MQTLISDVFLDEKEIEKVSSILSGKLITVSMNNDIYEDNILR